jgi:oligopeptide/dipeptide ABC transporter ATP-binding protein
MIEVVDLSKHYRVARRWGDGKGSVVKAVDGVSFQVRAGEALGLVGESGSGKSTLGQMLLLQTPQTAGRIVFEGREIRCDDRASLDAVKGAMQVVFQDPYDSLNPRMRVRDIIAEPLRNLGRIDERQIARRIEAVTEQVGLRVEDLVKFPHQFSGGQRQRIGIARALSVQPRFIVLDEPVSALDVSVQAQVVNLLMSVRRHHGIAYLFISHNLAIVEHVCDRVVILYLGKIVEVLGTPQLHSEPLHPYTRALIDAIPVPDPTQAGAVTPLPGEIPDPMNLPAGCRFSPRCALATERCRREEPVLTSMGGEHWMACHRSAELRPGVITMDQARGGNDETIRRPEG